MDDREAVTSEIKYLEEKLLKPDVRKSTEEMDELLSDDFFEFGSSGRVYNKAQVISSLRNEPVSAISIENFKAGMLADGVVHVTYTAVKSGADGEKESRSLRSSIWVNTNGRWRILFHQGTLV